VNGLDIGQFLTHLERKHNEHHHNPRVVIFKELDTAKQNHPVAFRSGKALTALISAAARRRNPRIAYVVWDWLNEQHRKPDEPPASASWDFRIAKTTYHYNSMITVAASARNPQHALDLLEEMSKLGISKNEVT